MAKMFIGPKDNPVVMQAPERGMQHSMERFYSETSFLNGGQQSYASKAFRNVYSLNLPSIDALGPLGASLIRRIMSGEFGDEFIYYTDPVAMRTNVFCSQWANPSLVEMGDWVNLYTGSPE